MSRKAKTILGVLAVLVAAVVVIVLWPAPDPLRNANTVYIDTGATQGSRGAAEIEEGLGVVLNNRNLTIVFNRAQADVVVRVQNVTVNLGDVTVSLGQGGLSGRVRAVCDVTDLRSGRTHTMDLTVTVRDGAVSATLVGRKFWEFWK